MKNNNGPFVLVFLWHVVYRSHGSLEQELEQLREEYSQEKMKLQELQRVTGRRERGGERRKGGKEGDRQDTDDSPLTEPQSKDTCTPGHLPSLPAAHKQLFTKDTESRSTSGNERVKTQMSEDGERVKSQSPDLKSEEDWSETSGTVGSIQLEDLALPVASRPAREGEGRRDRREKTSGRKKEKEKQKRTKPKKRVPPQTPRVMIVSVPLSSHHTITCIKNAEVRVFNQSGGSDYFSDLLISTCTNQRNTKFSIATLKFIPRLIVSLRP